MAGGMELDFFRALKFQISEPEIGKNCTFCGISGILLETEKYFSDSGRWPFHTPPFHTPTKCRPIIFLISKPLRPCFFYETQDL